MGAPQKKMKQICLPDEMFALTLEEWEGLLRARKRKGELLRVEALRNPIISQEEYKRIIAGAETAFKKLKRSLQDYHAMDSAERAKVEFESNGLVRNPSFCGASE